MTDNAAWLNMTIDEALDYADAWTRGMTLYSGATGWRVVCLLLAEEVRRLRGERDDISGD